MRMVAVSNPTLQLWRYDSGLGEIPRLTRTELVAALIQVPRLGRPVPPPLPPAPNPETDTDA